MERTVEVESTSLVWKTRAQAAIPRSLKTYLIVKDPTSKWSGTSESNTRSAVPKTAGLPLSQSPLKTKSPESFRTGALEDHVNEIPLPRRTRVDIDGPLPHRFRAAEMEFLCHWDQSIRTYSRMQLKKWRRAKESNPHPCGAHVFETCWRTIAPGLAVLGAPGVSRTRHEWLCRPPLSRLASGA